MLRNGDRIHAVGRVVALPDRPERFCAPVSVPAVGWTRGHEPSPAYCDWGVDVRGVDLRALSSGRAKGGAVEGYADLAGVYHAPGLLAVDTQRPYPLKAPPMPPEKPPCPAPGGGWPTGAANENLDLRPIEDYSRAHPGAVLTPGELRPSRRQVIAYVLTLTDPTPVSTALRPVYGTRLCVAQSRYTGAQINHAAQAFKPMLVSPNGAGVFSVGSGGLSSGGQPVVDIDLVRVTPQLAALADKQPAGLIRLHPWLRPAAGSTHR